MTRKKLLEIRKNIRLILLVEIIKFPLFIISNLILSLKLQLNLCNIFEEKLIIKDNFHFFFAIYTKSDQNFCDRKLINEILLQRDFTLKYKFSYCRIIYGFFFTK